MFKIYQHFKGGIYVKLTEAVNTETNEIMVVYVCASSGKAFVRPKEMFYSHVNRDSYSGPRFREIPSELGEKVKQGYKLM